MEDAWRTFSGSRTGTLTVLAGLDADVRRAVVRASCVYPQMASLVPESDTACVTTTYDGTAQGFSTVVGQLRSNVELRALG